MKKIKEILGLPLNATEDKVVEVISEMLNKQTNVEDGSNVDKLKSTISDLEQQVKDLSLGKVESPVSQEKIEAGAKEVFELNEKIHRIWGTDDGHFFFNPSDANDHRKRIGGEVKSYNR